MPTPDNVVPNDGVSAKLDKKSIEDGCKTIKTAKDNTYARPLLPSSLGLITA